jgi:hypothetical protein
MTKTITEKDLAQIRKLCFEFVSKDQQVYYAKYGKDRYDEEVTMADVEKAVFMIEGENGQEIRLSNEFGNWFCDYYLDYEHSYGNCKADEMIQYIEKKVKGKFELEWYNSAYLVAFKQ